MLALSVQYERIEFGEYLFLYNQGPKKIELGTRCQTNQRDLLQLIFLAILKLATEQFP